MFVEHGEKAAIFAEFDQLCLILAPKLKRDRCRLLQERIKWLFWAERCGVINLEFGLFCSSESWHLIAF
jgi:hypothetical protein